MHKLKLLNTFDYTKSLLFTNAKIDNNVFQISNSMIPTSKEYVTYCEIADKLDMTKYRYILNQRNVSSEMRHSFKNELAYAQEVVNARTSVSQSTRWQDIIPLNKHRVVKVYLDQNSSNFNHAGIYNSVHNPEYVDLIKACTTHYCLATRLPNNQIVFRHFTRHPKKGVPFDCVSDCSDLMGADNAQFLCGRAIIVNVDDIISVTRLHVMNPELKIKILNGDLPNSTEQISEVLAFHNYNNGTRISEYMNNAKENLKELQEEVEETTYYFIEILMS